MITVNYIWKHLVFAYPKREQSTELSWQCHLARHFKTETTDIVPFSFGICENKVFSNVIDSYHLVDERYIKTNTILVFIKSSSV
jgi:hypothetical protein